MIHSKRAYIQKENHSSVFISTEKKISKLYAKK